MGKQCLTGKAEHHAAGACKYRWNNIGIQMKRIATLFQSAIENDLEKEGTLLSSSATTILGMSLVSRHKYKLSTQGVQTLMQPPCQQLQMSNIMKFQKIAVEKNF
jgi:GTP-sensing pleiotropic transcriptional regulator CodY